MKWLISGIIVTALSIGIIIWFIFLTPRPMPPTTGTSIIAFGDSLVEGVGSTPGNDFVSVLSRKLNTPIINAGRSGDTTADALSRITSDVLNHDPKIVIVLLGGNDILGQVPKEIMFKNLAAIIDAIQARGAAVLLVGIRGGLFVDGYHSDFKKLAREKRVYYLSDALQSIFANPQYKSDEIHPNDAGYAIIADRIEAVLREML